MPSRDPADVRSAPALSAAPGRAVRSGYAPCRLWFRCYAAESSFAKVGRTKANNHSGADQTLSWKVGGARTSDFGLRISDFTSYAPAR